MDRLGCRGVGRRFFLGPPTCCASRSRIQQGVCDHSVELRNGQPAMVYQESGEKLRSWDRTDDLVADTWKCASGVIPPSGKGVAEMLTGLY